jgi:membrane protease YdiL (CAAX protease family)
MKLLNQPFLAPLKTTKKEAIFWIAIIVLMVLKIYEGDRTFWEQHFSSGVTDEQLYRWYKWLYHHLATLVLFALIPMLIITTQFKEKLRDFGWQLGDWKFGLKATLITGVIMPFMVYNSSLKPHHFDFYHSNFPLDMATSSVAMFALWGLSYLPHYLGWEFFFRGFVQFGFAKKYGVFMALMFQVLLTALMHIGKPEVETWGAVLGGIYMGLLAYRTKSIAWPLAFHFYVGMLNSYFCR